MNKECVPRKNQQLDKTQKDSKLENANYKSAAKRKKGYRFFLEAFFVDYRYIKFYPTKKK
jgi:hypothetical protein